MNNDLINELYSKIDNQEKIIVDLQKNNSGITLEEHVRVLNAYQELREKYNKQKEVIDKINNYIDNYDIFKVFSFPLMKRWEEEQVKSSIDYEFKTSLIKDLKEILEDEEVSE